jgi:hypothetical protein
MLALAAQQLLSPDVLLYGTFTSMLPQNDIIPLGNVQTVPLPARGRQLTLGESFARSVRRRVV